MAGRAMLEGVSSPVSTVIIIPAYNEAQALPETLTELRGLEGAPTLVVVDDGSDDPTSAVAHAAGAAVLRLPFNLGVGAAVRTGLRWAADHGAERAVVVDADGQHAPQGVADLLAALDAGADVVVGSRFTGDGTYEVGPMRRAAMRSLARTVRRVTHQDLTDVTSGFRAFDRKAIELLAHEYPAEFLADTVEVLLVVHNAGLTIAEVPVEMRPRRAGRPSTRGLRLAIDFLRLRIGIASAAYRRGRPRRDDPARREGKDQR